MAVVAVVFGGISYGVAGNGCGVLSYHGDLEGTTGISWAVASEVPYNKHCPLSCLPFKGCLDYMLMETRFI